MPESVDRIQDFLSEITDELAGTLKKGKDRVLFNGYLLSMLDFATNKPAVDRYFSRCEVEYILWGYDNSWDNIRRTALQLFLLRTSIHILKAVAALEVVDKVTLIKTITEGIVEGSADVEKLFAGERITLLPGVSLASVSYKDHLRLLLSCQNESEQRKNLQKLVQANLWHWAGKASDSGKEGVDAFALDRYATEIRIAAETELILWPFGSIRIRREGVMGYDRPFSLLPQE